MCLRLRTAQLTTGWMGDLGDPGGVKGFWVFLVVFWRLNFLVWVDFCNWGSVVVEMVGVLVEQVSAAHMSYMVGQG